MRSGDTYLSARLDRLAATLEEGLSLAYGSIDSGRALAKLRSLFEEGGSK